MKRLEAVSENLANSTMPGYRKIQANPKIFDLIYRQAMSDPINWQAGEKYDPLTVDFTPGPIRSTERPLDFALKGDGFFVLTKDGKEFYSRDGSFSMDNEGRLVNSGNLLVKGRNGEIQIPPRTVISNLSVSSDGTLHDGTKVIDTIQFASFPDVSKLSRVGPALFAPPAGMKAIEQPETTEVIGRSLEQSNTTVFEEMAETISCMRAFEACQRMIRTQDEAQGKLIQQLG
ncbi:MAG: flagellar hook-basal body protein [Lentisphaerota bacterium]